MELNDKFKHIDRMSKFSDFETSSKDKNERKKLGMDFMEQCRKLFGGKFFGSKYGEVKNINGEEKGINGGKALYIIL